MNALSRVWNPVDLSYRLGRVLEVAEQATELLSEPSDTHAEHGVSPEKVVAETALLLLVAAPACQRDSQLAVRWRELLERLQPWARGARVQVGICLQPALAGDYAFAHACLNRLGFPDEQFDRLLAECLALSEAGSKERLPHQELEQEWLQKGLASAPQSGRECMPLAAQSMLGRPLDALTCTRDDVYALTNALMYYIDLGSGVRRLPRPRARVMTDIEAALAWCLDQQDYDMAESCSWRGRSLLSRGRPPGASALAVLMAVEDQAGVLPSPLFRLDQYEKLPAAEQRRYLLLATYHTAYVMGLLCGAILKSGRLRSQPVRSRRFHGAAAGLLDLLDGDGRPPHWRDTLRLYIRADQDALTPLLLSICLRRGVEGRNLEVLRVTLRHADRYELLGTPINGSAARHPR
jgi:uncharacterized protein DUF6895